MFSWREEWTADSVGKTIETAPNCLEKSGEPLIHLGLDGGISEVELRFKFRALREWPASPEYTFSDWIGIEIAWTGIEKTQLKTNHILNYPKHWSQDTIMVPRKHPPSRIVYY